MGKKRGKRRGGRKGRKGGHRRGGHRGGGGSLSLFGMKVAPWMFMAGLFLVGEVLEDTVLAGKLPAWLPGSALVAWAYGTWKHVPMAAAAGLALMGLQLAKNYGLKTKLAGMLPASMQGGSNSTIASETNAAINAGSQIASLVGGGTGSGNNGYIQGTDPLGNTAGQAAFDAAIANGGNIQTAQQAGNSAYQNAVNS